MTSINALRLDYHTGLLICDEARYWNPEWMIFYTPEKIRSVIRDDIRGDQGMVMFMGQTGTSSIGDEWIQEIRRQISVEYDALREEHGGNPGDFHSLKQLSELAFRVITRIKHRHVDDFLIGKFGFTTRDLVQGYYTSSENNKVDISDKEIIDKAVKYVTFSGNPEEVKGIYGNSQILAGYRPEEGFRIYYMTERWPVCEEVNEIFIAQGSGRDTCDLVYARFADASRLRERKGQKAIHRADGLIALLRGLNNAMAQTAGVGGYPKIIYVDGHKKKPGDWVMEICDGRTRLAQEMVLAESQRFISYKELKDLIERLIFKNASFGEIDARFMKSARNAGDLFKFLRGYPG